MPAQTALRLEPAEVPERPISQPLRFFRLRISKRFVAIRAPQITLIEPVLIQLDGYGIFVYHTFGEPPTLKEVSRYLNGDDGAVSEGNYSIFIEARTPAEAWEKFCDQNPEATGKNPAVTHPALRLDRRHGAEAHVMPSCDEMVRRGKDISCRLRQAAGIDKDYCACIVQHGWPPSGCPIAKAIRFDFTEPPFPYSAEPPF
jgi:hypothetical protein